MISLTIKEANTKQLQWLIWILVFSIPVLSLLPTEKLSWALSYTLINTSFYAIIIYGNISFLFPRFYQKGRKVLYFIYSFLFLATFGSLKGYLVLHLFYVNAEHPEPINYARILIIALGGVFIFLLSFIFRIALAYFGLKQQTEDILLQKTKAELNLLKSQVQPHFLFNTLNNIYYEAYLEAPRAALLIGQLSDMMRYFVDESPKHEVLIATEVGFLQNYIELEKIRIKHQITINFQQTFDPTASIPPMLMMTLVENIFKHGIDKSDSNNLIDISLKQMDHELTFTTTNKRYEQEPSPSGFGIENLRKRLTILYGEHFELNTTSTDQFFTAYFKIPIA